MGGMDLHLLAVDAALGAAAGLLGWLLTRRLVQMKPQTARLVTVALVVAAVTVGNQVVSPIVNAWSAERQTYEAGMAVYGNEQAARALADVMKPMFRDPLLIARLEKASAGAVARPAAAFAPATARQAVFAQLTAGGLSRLPGEDLDQFFAVKRSLADASPEVCAGFWTGRFRPDAISAALRRLPGAKQVVWIRTTALAASLELHATAPPARIPGAKADEASGHMLAALTPESRAAYVQATSATAITDAQGCAGFTAFAQGLDRLPTDERRLLIRALNGPQLVDR
jgi:hypothetical protein